MGPRPIAEQVVVITGASSGIGRETAIGFGKRGACVVLAARGEAALHAVAREVEHAGGTAYALVTDVGDADQVQRLADQAIHRFGRIDTWVNNASVSAFATFEQLAVAEIDQILKVDLAGAIYGTRAAIPYLEEHGGTIICVGSVLGERAFPLLAIYSAAKHGLKGFVEAVRVELRRDHPGITITLIVPSSIDTPFYAHARSKRGVRPKPFPLVYPARAVADAILYAAEHRRRQIYAGGTGRVLALLERISPSLIDRLMLQNDRAFRYMLSDRVDHGEDNLFVSANQVRAPSGAPEWQVLRGSWYTRLVELGGWRVVLAAAAGIAGAGLALRQQLRAA
jgi:short-subunit dehydrogenase